jgi:hypothetical protein
VVPVLVTTFCDPVVVGVGAVFVVIFVVVFGNDTGVELGLEVGS